MVSSFRTALPISIDNSSVKITLRQAYPKVSFCPLTPFPAIHRAHGRLAPLHPLVIPFFMGRLSDRGR